MIRFNNRRNAPGSTSITGHAKDVRRLSDAEAFKNRQERNGSRLEALASGQGLESTSMGGARPQMADYPLTIDTDPLMEGMDYELQDKILFNIYRDMYWHDPVCGSAVDMFSTLPFSEFSIGGAKEQYLDAYRDAIEVLNMRTIFPELTIDYKVTGGFCASFLYNKQNKRFIDLMTHRLDNIDVHPLPFYGQDPILTLELDRHMKKTLQMDSPRIDRLKTTIGEEFFGKLLQDRLELDPIGTLYLPRKSMSYSGPTSYFKRILPIWLIEKNLYRGTLIESGRRQRGIMHLQIGDGDQWEPSPEDFEAIASLFNNADADPIGAVVATRLGVQVDELRQGGDFWKVTDLWNETTYVKMRALGISEAFLSGDASYANMEGSLTVFVESIRAYRESITRRVFYDKLFPLVSIMNGYTSNAKGKIIRKDGLMQQDSEQILRQMNDGNKLFIPSVHWAKQLKPEADQQYMEMLRQMQEMGVPVPLRAMAAAGGFNLDSLLTNREEDLMLHKQINDYNKQKAKLTGEGEGGGGEEGGFGGSFSGSRSRILGGRRQPSLMDRDFGEASEITGLSRTGKKKWIYDQRAANERANNAIYKAMTNLDHNDPRTAHLFQSTATSMAPSGYDPVEGRVHRSVKRDYAKGRKLAKQAKAQRRRRR